MKREKYPISHITMALQTRCVVPAILLAALASALPAQAAVVMHYTVQDQPEGAELTEVQLGDVLYGDITLDAPQDGYRSVHI